MLKKAPAQTIDNLIPPASNYVYFENAARLSFTPDATDLNLINAGWLVDAALLAYGDPLFLKMALGDRQIFKESLFFNGPSTQGLLLVTDTFAILTFRGTRLERKDPLAMVGQVLALSGQAQLPSWLVALSNPDDIKTDADILLTDEGIHHGFDTALDQVWSDKSVISEPIMSVLASQRDLPLWLTGHSLGAALATVAAARLKRSGVQVQGLYTFGSPRVGNAVFANTVPTPCFRFVNNTDLVTHLPAPAPRMAYTDVGSLEFIRPDGSIVPEAPALDQAKDQIAGWFGALRQAAATAIGMPLDQFFNNVRRLNTEVPIAGFNDHAPINYATHIWNAATRD